MRIDLPLYAQERDDSCALACLRMVLAAFGTDVKESALRAAARAEEGGTAIEELERLAHAYRLEASVQTATTTELQAFLAAGQFPIAYVNRSALEAPSLRIARRAVRRPTVHAVIPVQFTKAFVTFLDPLPPAVPRKSIERFTLAHRQLGSLCLVCGPAEGRR